MQSILLLVPIFKKVEFDRLCHNNAVRATANNGLSQIEIDEFYQQLQERGFIIKTFLLPADGNEQYTQPIFVEAELPWSFLNPKGMLTEGGSLPLKYDVILFLDPFP